MKCVSIQNIIILENKNWKRISVVIKSGGALSPFTKMGVQPPLPPSALPRTNQLQVLLLFLNTCF